MVSKVDKIRISGQPEFDRRRKLSVKDRNAIRDAWFNVHPAQRPTMTALGAKYNVHRTLISIILYPERDAKKREQFKARQKDGRYYDREKARQNQKDHRAYKQKLLLEGKLDA